MVLRSLVKCLFTSCLDYKSPWIHGLLQVSPPLPSLPDSPIFHISVGLSWGGRGEIKKAPSRVPPPPLPGGLEPHSWTFWNFVWPENIRHKATACPVHWRRAD